MKYCHDNIGYMPAALNIPFYGQFRSLRLFAQVAAGLGHTVAATKDGSLFSWGWNAGNQLGLGPKESSQVVTLPYKVDMKVQIHHLAAGRAHSLCSAREPSPAAYAWGSGREGRLGLGSQQGSDCPEAVPALEGCFVLDLACGMDHSVVLVES